MSFTETTSLIELQPDVKLRIIQSTPTQIKSQSAPTVIFLHFWGGSSSTWSQVNDMIGETIPTIRVDFRGWGSSTGPDSETRYSTLNLAQDIQGIIQRLELRRYIIVGHSMGAKVAQAFAGQDVDGGLVGLVLACPAPPTPLELPEEMRRQQIDAYSNSENAESVTRNVLTSQQLPDRIVQLTVQDMLKGNPFARKAWPEHAMRDDISQLAKLISVPVLVVAGGMDDVEPVSRIKTEVCGVLADSTLVVVNESGHLLPLEAPERLAELIRDFSSHFTL
ncbi:hypothetical protein FZEAL_3098 [Fusarium zealandicum]|uniref:AB hydrolase-1 domain-containing protein n=1 Tax=Fusarium zealandicum TaxID=1053134 RepID=A0A8H4UPI2_9HYPO|nr:hypothetical protein FZEAL_3098 [Fusarium zealandicum]